MSKPGKSPVLHRLLVINPHVNEDEDGAEDNLLYHWPGAAGGVSLDDQLMESGLATALLGLVGNFTDADIEHATTRMFSYSFLPIYEKTWMVLITTRPASPAPSRIRRSAAAARTNRSAVALEADAGPPIPNTEVRTDAPPTLRTAMLHYALSVLELHTGGIGMIMKNASSSPPPPDASSLASAQPPTVPLPPPAMSSPPTPPVASTSAGTSANATGASPPRKPKKRKTSVEGSDAAWAAVREALTRIFTPWCNTLALELCDSFDVLRGVRYLYTDCRSMVRLHALLAGLVCTTAGFGGYHAVVGEFLLGSSFAAATTYCLTRYILARAPLPLNDSPAALAEVGGGVVQLLTAPFVARSGASAPVRVATTPGGGGGGSGVGDSGGGSGGGSVGGGAHPPPPLHGMVGDGPSLGEATPTWLTAPAGSGVVDPALAAIAAKELSDAIPPWFLASVRYRPVAAIPTSVAPTYVYVEPSTELCPNKYLLASLQIGKACLSFAIDARIASGAVFDAVAAIIAANELENRLIASVAARPQRYDPHWVFLYFNRLNGAVRSNLRPLHADAPRVGGVGGGGDTSSAQRFTPTELADAHASILSVRTELEVRPRQADTHLRELDVRIRPDAFIHGAASLGREFFVPRFRCGTLTALDDDVTAICAAQFRDMFTDGL